ncbi:MAG: TonB-dependent receptor plug domain-containing protein [Alphaproteobacteria bacterium]|nr:TonB-dependent receptor plug domain-containing protein [Alphaproteobacteria bacterium]
MTLPLLLLAHPALSAAEDDEAFEADPALQHLEELVVTGSRIRRPDLTSASPLVRAEAEDLLSQGTVRVEDTLRSLPQEFTNQNASQSYSATGTATVNLRGLGAKRTLVLVNGRRLPAGLPIQGGGGADINQIPGALIASIDVLTGRTPSPAS